MKFVFINHLIMLTSKSLVNHFSHNFFVNFLCIYLSLTTEKVHLSGYLIQTACSWDTTQCRTNHVQDTVSNCLSLVTIISWVLVNLVFFLASSVFALHQLRSDPWNCWGKPIPLSWWGSPWNPLKISERNPRLPFCLFSYL